MKESLPVSGVCEIALEMRDLEAGERFYAGLLGFPVVERWTQRGGAVWLMAGERTRIGLWQPQIGLGGGRGGVHVHYAMHLSGEAYEAAVARLRKAGHEVLDHDHSGYGRGRGRAAYVTDPGGHVVELWTWDVAEHLRRERARGEPWKQLMRFVTRKNAAVDRIACPWLIRRFIDKDAEFIYAAPEEVMRVALERDAIPYDVEGAELGHVDGRCSFESILLKYGLDDPALARMAKIVHAADVEADLDTAPEGAGLKAIAMGFRQEFGDRDHEKLEAQMAMYDALYAWCQTS